MHMLISSSESTEENRGFLRVKSSSESTYLQVIDASSNVVAAGSHRLAVSLAPGIYKLHAERPGDLISRLVVVEAQSDVNVDDFTPEFKSPTPLPQNRCVSDAQRLAAEDQSKRVQLSLGPSLTSRLFVFARSNAGVAWEEFPRFSILDSNGGVVLVSSEECTRSPNNDWIALNVDLPSGTYTLSYDVPEFGKRQQVIFVERGWETQIFALAEDYVDFAEARIHMRRLNSGFSLARSNEYELSETALLYMQRGWSADFPHQVSSEAIANDPVLGLIVCYFLLEQADVDFTLVSLFSEQLKELLPTSTDVGIISLFTELRGELPSRWFFVLQQKNWFLNPALFALGTELQMKLAAEVGVLCPVNSYLAEVALRLTTTTTWTRWNADMSRIQAERRLQNTLSQLLIANPGKPNVALSRELKLPLSLVVDALKKIRPNPDWARDITRVLSNVKSERSQSPAYASREVASFVLGTQSQGPMSYMLSVQESPEVPRANAISHISLQLPEHRQPRFYVTASYKYTQKMEHRVLVDPDMMGRAVVSFNPSSAQIIPRHSETIRTLNKVRRRTSRLMDIMGDADRWVPEGYVSLNKG
jgi:hypothetical protein